MTRSKSYRSDVINQMLIIEYIMNNDNVRAVGFRFEPEPVRETRTTSSYLDDVLGDEKSASKRKTQYPGV